MCVVAPLPRREGTQSWVRRAGGGRGGAGALSTGAGPCPGSCPPKHEPVGPALEKRRDGEKNPRNVSVYVVKTPGTEDLCLSPGRRRAGMDASHQMEKERPEEEGENQEVVVPAGKTVRKTQWEAVKYC